MKTENLRVTFPASSRKIMEEKPFPRKISPEQRDIMMSYMEAYPCFARNRMSGPRGGMEKNKKWEELAKLLNSCATGTTKSPEKWSRCWQDWKVDVKQKAARLRRHTAGGPSKEHRTPLTATEERLLSFIGETAVSGVAGIVDPDEKMDYNLKREWPATDVENLIFAYKSRPCLWDVCSADFKDKYAKNKAINELAREFNTSTAEISRKIHNLRNQFNSEMKKTLQRMSGKGTTEINVSKWPHFQSLMFLKASVISRDPREPTKNCAHSENIRELGEEDPLEEPNMQNSDEFNPEEINIIKCEELVGKSKKRKKTTVICDSDQYDTFGEFVASEIRNLSVDFLRKKMKRRIQKVILEILEEEEEMLSN